jgi:predicted nucleotidyltransferase
MTTTTDDTCQIFDEGYGYDGKWCPCSRCTASAYRLEMAAKQKRDKVTSCKITAYDKSVLTEFVMEWATQYEGMQVLFIGLGSSSFADGRATNESDYDLYIVYDDYGEDIQISDMEYKASSKVYKIDIQGHPREKFNTLIEEWDEIPMLNLEGAISNPEQLLIYKAPDYELYKRQSIDLEKLRKSFSKKISQTVGKKRNASSKAKNKFFKPKSQDDYIKGMKCFYFAWKLVIYAIQLAKPENNHQIVDFAEPYAFWERLQIIHPDVIHSENGYNACYDVLEEAGFKKKFKEFQKLAPKNT